MVLSILILYEYVILLVDDAAVTSLSLIPNPKVFSLVCGMYYTNICTTAPVLIVAY